MELPTRLRERRRIGPWDAGPRVCAGRLGANERASALGKPVRSTRRCRGRSRSVTASWVCVGRSASEPMAARSILRTARRHRTSALLARSRVITHSGSIRGRPVPVHVARLMWTTNAAAVGLRVDAPVWASGAQSFGRVGCGDGEASANSSPTMSTLVPLRRGLARWVGRDGQGAAGPNDLVELSFVRGGGRSGPQVPRRGTCKGACPGEAAPTTPRPGFNDAFNDAPGGPSTGRLDRTARAERGPPRARPEPPREPPRPQSSPPPSGSGARGSPVAPNPAGTGPSGHRRPLGALSGAPWVAVPPPREQLGLASCDLSCWSPGSDPPPFSATAARHAS